MIGEEYRKQGQFREAVQSAHQSVTVAHEIQDPGSEASSLAVLMGVHKDMNRPRFAIFYGKRAVNLMQSVRAENRGLPREFQNSLLKLNDDMFHALADLRIGEGRLSEAEQVLALLKDEDF